MYPHARYASCRSIASRVYIHGSHLPCFAPQYMYATDQLCLGVHPSAFPNKYRLCVRTYTQIHTHPYTYTLVLTPARVHVGYTMCTNTRRPY